MESHSNKQKGAADNTIVIATVVTAVFVVFVLSLLITTFALPRLMRGGDNYPEFKGERMQQRLEEINKVVKTQNYLEWRSMQNGRDSNSLYATDSLCVICLEDFTSDAQIRSLQCLHAFHVQCLDEWFTRFNEYCPLCHRAIIPGKKIAKQTNSTAQMMTLGYVV